MTDEPIAIYRENRLMERRTYELFSDRIRIYGKRLLGSRFDQTIPLTMLHPEIVRMWERGKPWGGLMMFFWAIVLVVLLWITYGIESVTNFFNATAISALGTAGLISVLISIRQIEYAAFTNNVGVIILTIGRVGSQPSEFDAFVELLVERIGASSSSP